MTAATDGDLPPWRQRLRGALKREGRQVSARWLQLATVTSDGTPRVRTLVFRGWNGADQLELYTDGRSSKIAELNHQPQVELCWLLTKAKQQYRLRGIAAPVAASPDQAQWRSLSPSGRALWGWPHPGQPFEPAAPFPQELPEDAPVPDHFLVVPISIQQVELLDLSHHPHQRLLWRREDGWLEQRLNP